MLYTKAGCFQVSKVGTISNEFSSHCNNSRIEWEYSLLPEGVRMNWEKKQRGVDHKVFCLRLILTGRKNFYHEPERVNWHFLSQEWQTPSTRIPRDANLYRSIRIPLKLVHWCHLELRNEFWDYSLSRSVTGSSSFPSEHVMCACMRDVVCCGAIRQRFPEKMVEIGGEQPTVILIGKKWRKLCLHDSCCCLPPCLHVHHFWSCYGPSFARYIHTHWVNHFHLNFICRWLCAVKNFLSMVKCNYSCKENA